MNLDDYRWLVEAKAVRRLSELAAVTEVSKPSLTKLVGDLRKELSPVQAHLLLEQLELRKRAREKFVQADAMFFTRIGLEQATDQWIAAYKASRFSPGAVIADLCCGIGGDLLGLAQRRPALGIDRDPIALLLAKANCAGVGCNGAGQGEANFLAADVEAINLNTVAAWHIDPNRRPAGRRTTRVELHEPGPDAMHRLLAECPNAAIKLAPAATLEETWWQEAELEWISRNRQCRQLVAWFGELAQHPRGHRATVIRPAGDGSVGESNFEIAATFVGEPIVEAATAAKIGRYLYEPDAAILAAKLQGALAADQNLAAIAPGLDYFTSDQPISHGAVSCFEVLDVMPYQPKRLRSWLAARNVGRLEIKKRGAPLDPDQVRRELQVDGAEEATILLARLGGRITAILARRGKNRVLLTPRPTRQ